MKYNQFKRNETLLDIKKAIWEIVGINEVSYKQKENWINVTVAADTPPVVYTDSERVIQILQNLLVRALLLSH